jgi:methyl-accepting chemotaxis protein
LGSRLLIVTVGAVVLVLLASNYILIGQSAGRIEALTMEQARLEASAIAHELAASIGEMAAASRTMSGVLGTAHEQKLVGRKELVDILKANVERHPYASAAFFGEDVGAFDGRTMEVAGRIEEGTNDSGVMTPVWLRTEDGGLKLTNFPNHFDGE